MKTDLESFLSECNAGIMQEKIAVALSDAALAQVNHGEGNKKAKVAVEFTFQRMGEQSQVIVSHKIMTKTPTKRGVKTEEDITETAFFVGKGGALSIEPPKEDSNGQFNMTSEQDGKISAIHR